MEEEILVASRVPDTSLSERQEDPAVDGNGPASAKDRRLWSAVIFQTCAVFVRRSGGREKETEDAATGGKKFLWASTAARVIRRRAICHTHRSDAQVKVRHLFAVELLRVRHRGHAMRKETRQTKHREGKSSQIDDDNERR
eukprot:758714-Hanusia_phi.AAC.6